MNASVAHIHCLRIHFPITCTSVTQKTCFEQAEPKQKDILEKIIRKAPDTFKLLRRVVRAV